MGFTDSKMSDLNFLPKKHTNFSIENILLKQKSEPSSGRASFEIEQKVDLTVKTCIKYEQDDLKVATAPATTTTSSHLQQTRPLNRVLANPWCSRGPLMFDPKMMISGAKATTTATAAPSSTAATTPSLLSPSAHIKTEVERKVVLSTYANSSVIERNRLSINYPYPVGFFNAYAASIATHHHHQQQHLNHHHHQLHRHLEQQSVTAVPTVLNSSVASSLHSFHLDKSDENQNSIFPHLTSNGSNSSHGSSFPSDSTPTTTSNNLPFFGLEPGDLLAGAGGSSPVSGSVGATSFGTLVGFPEFSFQCQICDKIFGTQDTLMVSEGFVAGESVQVAGGFYVSAWRRVVDKLV